MNIKKITCLQAATSVSYKYFLSLAEHKNVRWLGFLGALVLATFFYFLATRNGNLSTADSLFYKEIATNLAKDFSYSREGIFISVWPPLYPLMLAFANGNMDSFIHVFHWVCLLATLLVWTKIGRLFLPDRWLVLFIISLSVATPVMMLAVFVWSEIFFLLLLSSYIFYCLRFIKGANNHDLWVAALFGFLMMLQRNVGFFLFAGSLAGLLINYFFYGGKKIIPIVIHGFLAIAGFACWNIYALLFREKMDVMGELVPLFNPQRNFLISFREIGMNFIPDLVPYGTPLFGFLIFAGAGIYAASAGRLQELLLYLYIVLSTYMLTWLIIPADVHEIGRFMAIVIPFYYLFGILLLMLLTGKFSQFRVFAGLLALAWVLYAIVRISNNVLLWAGYSM